MLFEVLLLTYAIAIGFATAGIISSFYQLVTTRPAGFVLLGESAVAIFLSTLLFAVCGPLIMLRTAVNSRIVHGQPVAWLLGGVVIATVWGCCVGILALELALSIGHTLA